MITHDLIQGTPEWHEHRAKYFNASDAPAMMGVSSYKTRTQLLNEIATGIVPDVNAGTQALFDEGHRAEALARALAEEILGEELYPVVGTKGKLGASFDGLTMSYSVNFEHKLLNDKLRSCKTAHDLPMQYKIQMEQQHLVSGAEWTLFMATKWNGDELVEKVVFEYQPDLDLREKIVRGWDQFEIDLVNYVPQQIKESPKAETIMQLPTLAIQIKGEVSLSNLPSFKKAADSFVAQIKTDLTTDQDFADAEANVKFLDEAEKSLEQAKKAALSQTADIDELMRTIDQIKESMRTKRLSLDKLVKSKKEQIKAEIVTKGHEALAAHINTLNAEIKPVVLSIRGNFAEAIKNKRTVVSLHDAVNNELAQCKIAADSQAAIIRKNLAFLNECAADQKSLFADLLTLAVQPFEAFSAIVQNRLADELARIAKIELAAKEKAEQESKTIAPVFNPVSVYPSPTVAPAAQEKRAYHPNTPKTPSRNKIIEVVGNSMGVSLITAEKWLNELFATAGEI